MANLDLGLHPGEVRSVLVRYQEVAAIFIRACPCPAICALGL
jgi:hypothetical protein